MNTRSMTIAVVTALFSYAFFAPSEAISAGQHGHATNADIGKPGDAKDVKRTVEITMHDNYFEPEKLSFKEGETVRFVVTNKGAFVHEFNIATAAMHRAHAPEMMMMVEHGVLQPDSIDWEAAKAMIVSHPVVYEAA